MSTAARPLGANYRKLLASATAANLGDGLMAVALVWLASAVTRDALLIALVGVAERLPWLIFSLPAGVISDRFDRRLLIGWMDVCRVVVVAALGRLSAVGCAAAVCAVIAAGALGYFGAAFIPGMSGQFYKQFAMTIAVATVISAINSLTLSPALGAWHGSSAARWG